jgi:hypothetical protein
MTQLTLLGAVDTVVPGEAAVQVMPEVLELPMSDPPVTEPAKPGTVLPVALKPMSRVVLGIGFGGPYP